MIDIKRAVRQGLRNDSALTSVLGMDQDGEYKVYTYPLKPNVSKPYVSVHSIPMPGVEGVYGDEEVMERFIVQLSVWAATEEDAWALAPIVDEAIKKLTLEVTPYEHNFTQRYQSVESLQDEDSSLWQVVMRYELSIGR